MNRNHSDKMELLARIGYATRGVIYLIIGVLAVDAAFGGGGKTTGARGAILTITDEAYGQVLLWIMAIGLVGYALWRLIQSFMDADHHGSDAKGIVIRIAMFVSALAHLALAYFTWGLIFGWGTGGGGSSNKQQWTAQLLQESYGRWIVGLIGVAVIGAGVAQWIKAGMGKYKKRLAMDRQKMKWAAPICSFGLIARGVVFAIIGVFFIVAAYQVSAGAVKSMQEALFVVQRQPYGGYLFATVAFGLVAFAIYCFIQARYRTINPQV